MNTWRVIINGQDSGIIETNFAFAKPWWDARAIRTGNCIRLKAI